MLMFDIDNFSLNIMEFLIVHINIITNILNKKYSHKA